MATFMTAYLVVWLAVTIYIGRMGIRQRQLQQSLDALQDRLQREAGERESRAKAA